MAVSQYDSADDIAEVMAQIEEQDTNEAIALVEALQASERQEQPLPQVNIEDRQALEQIESQEIQDAINMVEAIKALEESGERIDYELNQKVWNKDDADPMIVQQSHNSDDTFIYEDEDEDGWQCPTCTKWNEDQIQKCGSCNMDRGETNCPICFDSIGADELFLVSMCNHRFCKTCVKGAVLADMNSNMVPIQCPVCKTSKCDQCGFALGRGPEQEGGNCCILNQRDIKELLDNRDYERYLNIEARETCKDYQFFQCPGPNCVNYYEIQENQDRFVCPICEFNFCIQCGVPWHENSDCQKYQRWRQENNQGDQKFEEMRKKFGMKQCPKCHLHVIKDSPHQCNKMTCNNCNPRVYFCWICGQQIKGYEHFNNSNSPCNGKLWQGVNIPV